MQHAALVRGILGGATLLLVGLAAGGHMVSERARNVALTEARGAVERVALVAVSTVNRQILEVDSTLASIPPLLRQEGEAAELSWEGSARLLAFLRRQNQRLRDLVILGPDGLPLASAIPASSVRPLPLPAEEIRGLSRTAGLAIRGPVRNPQTGEWSLYFLRPFQLRDFAGFVVAEVPISLVTHQLSPLVESRRFEITLERTDGRLLISLPHVEQLTGTRLPALPGFPADGQAALAERRLEPGPGLLATRRALYRDIHITVGLQQAVVLASWVETRNRIILLGAVAAVVVLLLCGALLWALRQREAREAERAAGRAVLERAIEAMPDGFVMFDPEDRLVTWNRRYAELYSHSRPGIRPGITFEELIRIGVAAGQYPQAGSDPEAFIAGILTFHQGNQPPLERLLPDGRWLLITERRTPDGYTVGIRTDITRLKRTMQALEESEARFVRAITAVGIGTWDWEVRPNVLNLSVGYEALHGVPVGRLRTPEDLLAQVHPEDREVLRRSLAAARLGESMAEGVEFRILLPQAGVRWLTMQGRPELDGEGAVIRVSGITQDVTARHLAESRIAYLARHDALTGLANRVVLMERLDLAVQRAQRGEGCAVHCLDLDRFKQVNDTLGHPVGDQLLKAVADRMRECLRGDDLAARTGGDEFVLLQSSTDGGSDATVLGERIIAALSKPFDVLGHTIHVGASIGLAIAPADGTSAAEVLKNADLALYAAKSEGRGRICRFEPAMHSRMQSRRKLEEDLRRAIGNREFVLFFQPIVNARTGAIASMETLLRWQHPENGLTGPDSFITVAEEIGLIEPIGCWVLQEACRQAAGWPGGVRLAVNLSPAQFAGRSIVTVVSEALAASGLDPGRLELEITENALLGDQPAIMEELHGLRAMGVSIAMDDFGTGYSSLSYLRKFPFDKVKIDKSFIRDIEVKNGVATIVESIIDLCSKLGITITAEGVEDQGQMFRLRALGATELQGYLFSRPVPQDTVEALLAGPAFDTSIAAGTVFPDVPKITRVA